MLRLEKERNAKKLEKNIKKSVSNTHRFCFIFLMFSSQQTTIQKKKLKKRVQTAMKDKMEIDEETEKVE